MDCILRNKKGGQRVLPERADRLEILRCGKAELGRRLQNPDKDLAPEIETERLCSI
jgi:hypothetical protein